MAIKQNWYVAASASPSSIQPPLLDCPRLGPANAIANRVRDPNTGFKRCKVVQLARARLRTRRKNRFTRKAVWQAA